jgi:hypothetical protein
LILKLSHRDNCSPEEVCYWLRCYKLSICIGRKSGAAVMSNNIKYGKYENNSWREKKVVSIICLGESKGVAATMSI